MLYGRRNADSSAPVRRASCNRAFVSSVDLLRIKCISLSSDDRSLPNRQDPGRHVWMVLAPAGRDFPACSGRTERALLQRTIRMGAS
jgi:hypothetical protein